MNELHLFAGIGGGILGGILLGHTCVCGVEIEPYCRKVLLQRQRDGIMPRFPIWDDIKTFDGTPWKGKVEVVCGGFPCQDISVAGKKKGISGKRSGLWNEMARVIREARPRFVFVENSPALVIRGLGSVLRDLASMGYNARWGVFRASECGAMHLRERIFIYAYADKILRDQSGNLRGRNNKKPEWLAEKNSKDWRGRLNELESMDVVSRIPSYAEGRRILHGFTDRLDRISAIGNAQFPAVVKLAWETLSDTRA